LDENYRPDVRSCPHLPRGRGFTRGRVFTVRRRGKNRIRADADAKNLKKFKKIIIFGSCCHLEKREKNFGFRFSIPKIPKIPRLRGRSRETKKVFSA
jgi:hypothetical protein